MRHTWGTMSNSLMKRPSSSKIDGVVPAAASFFIPGVGQLINGQGDKALGVFATWFVCGLGFLGALPVIGQVAGAVALGTQIYAVADGYITGRKKS